LWKDATQTVFGEGPSTAEIMLVGEQPGDREDRDGRPFVGPAGQFLDRALADAGVDRERVYVTNAVKHFKFEPRGRRRLHKRPNAGEIKICRRWLFDEIDAIGPRLIVALGATAAQSLAGRAIPVRPNRGKILDVHNGLRVFMTIHPSALLRLQDEEENALATRVLWTICARLSAWSSLPQARRTLDSAMRDNDSASVFDLGVRPVVALFVFLAPLAGTVFVLDRPALPWRALLLRRSRGGGVGRVMSGEGLRKDIANLIGPSAVVLDD
jgi:uracil-DNA glycosylase